MQLSELIEQLNQRFPTHYAEDWDPIGLHFGSRHQAIQRVMVALDVRPNVVQEAIDAKVDVLIVHHPPIFKSIERFDLDQSANQMYAQLIKHDIAVYALHTNVDRAPGGMNDWLGQALGLDQIQPWETNDELNTISLGRVGVFDRLLTREELIQTIKDAFGLEYVTTIERQPKDNYQSVAIIGGSGSSYIDTIQQLEVDVFITGDFTFHTGQEAYEYDYLTVDVGHYVEQIFNQQMTAIIARWIEDYQWPIELFTSQSNTNPFVIE